MSWHKKIILKLCLLIISTFAAILFIEVCLYFCGENRSLWQTKPYWSTKLDEELIYSLQPNKIGYFMEEEFIEKSTINSFGLRDREIEDYTKYDKRIIALGDSFTYGSGVNNGQTYSDVLESIFLNKAHKRIDVINAGVRGYGTDQEYKFYITRLHNRIKHDVLILGLHRNDIADNIGNPLYTIKDDRLEPLDATHTWIYFLTNLYQKAPRIIKKSKTFNFILSRLKGKDIFCLRPKTDRKGLNEWSMKKMVLQIKELNEMTKKEHIKLIVVIMPSKNYRADTYDWLRKEMDSSGIFFVDIAKLPIWKQKKEELFFKKDTHLNIAGYNVLAWKIYSGIKNFIDLN